MTDGLQEGVLPFTCVAREVGDTLEIEMSGELDMSVVTECEAALREPLLRRRSAVSLDLSRLRFTDSTGIRVMLDIRARTEALGGRFVLVAISPAVARVLEVAGLAEAFASN